MSESENNLGKDLYFTAPDSALTDAELKPISKPEQFRPEQRKTVETKEQNYKPVPVGELKLADLDNVDEEGEKFINEIIQFVSSRMSPQVSENVLNFSFLKAVEILLANPAYSEQVRFEDIAKADEKSLKEVLQIVVPTTMPTKIENLQLRENVKNDIYKAVLTIRQDIENYAKQNNDLLAEPKGINKLTGLIKSNLGINDESAVKRKELVEQLKFLEELEDLTSQGVLEVNPKMLATKVTFLNHSNKQYSTDTLAKAFEYGTSHIPSLVEYIEQLKDPEKLPGRILLNKVVDVFKKIAGGYAEPTSNLQRDVEFFKSGTTLGARTGSYARLQEHVVKMINVKY